MDVKIFQIFFSPSHHEKLDPAFESFDNSAPLEIQKYEFGVMEKLYSEGRLGASDLSGVVSHKFTEKTNRSGEQFIQWIKANPGYDAYFINPFPYEMASAYNIWIQGEIAHVGFLPLAQELFDEAKVGLDLYHMGRTHEKNLLFCNYWVGTPTFWKKYMGFAKPLSDLMIQHADRFFSNANYATPTPFFPFIIERLFSTFLLLHPEQKVLAYSFDPTEIQSKIENHSRRHYLEAAYPLMRQLDQLTLSPDDAKLARPLYQLIIQQAETVASLKNASS